MLTRFSLDIGTNTIGWAVFELDENGQELDIIDSNSHIFTDGRNKEFDFFKGR